ncbi:LysR substrate-binding domain-containing protein [Defluviimonas aestuarii]|uniref:LysR substrate-binding domain-containing protein n=1 Tax=Albidovulum aestuarii TaxID=1130726 RepID=UPI00249B33EF|nr:LysR substrate-binding domain-containing protein [Defluviimonas aestuarii]MDI3335000.1 LysR substrate-binding domain-containing protein [Defluviimonas aestuarii]
METRLPPFSGLTAFHAAVRHGTLTGAARELNVSQPAISRRIAQLEADLGTPLFDRSRKPVQMTEAGREMMAALRSGFDMIEAATDRIRRAAKGRVVTVSGPSGFVAYWLIPRLGALQEAIPGTVIRIISMEHGEAGRPGDVMIRFGVPDLQRQNEVKILGEEVFAAASPLYLARHKAPGTTDDLAGHTLLTMEDARRFWHDWPSWFAARGAKMPGGTRHLDFNSYAMLINAALAGQGVCLCWSGLLDSFFETGALVRLGDQSAASERGYFLALRDGHGARPEVREVLGWIAKTGGADALTSEPSH